MRDLKTLIDQLRRDRDLPDEELLTLISMEDESAEEYLAKNASEVREKIYGKDVYIRGLIEFTNYCRNDCYYCGIRRSNRCAQRYRLTKEDILSCCEEGYTLGFRTFVLQGGEDIWFTKERLTDIITAIKIISNTINCTLFFVSLSILFFLL